MTADSDDASAAARPEEIRDSALKAAAAAPDLETLEKLRVSVLGRKGSLTLMARALGALDAEQRREAGRNLNAVKDVVQTALEARQAALKDDAIEARLADETIDVTLPAAPEVAGLLHPISQTLDEVVAIFGEMGFALAEGPDIEDDFHNFTALNIPPEHPARQMHDTFYFPEAPDGERMLLRTHTSPVQIRAMQTQGAPIRIIAIGRTYRCDSDMTHTPMFHQVEGLYVDKAVHMGHLKGCLIEFCKAYFEVDDVPVRFRPSYFPFTEPSAEVDIGCARNRDRIEIGAGDDWLEILGSGMVHPNVLEAGGIDPDIYQGFAFGMGLERIAMLKYGMPDLRTFFEGDVRWLRHYGFVPLEAPSLLRGLTP